LNERKSLDARSQAAGGVLRSLAVIGQSEKKKNKPHKDYESTSLNKMMIGEGNGWRLESGPWEPQARDQEPERPRIKDETRKAMDIKCFRIMGR
jgi:hypothetical protein